MDRDSKGRFIKGRKETQEETLKRLISIEENIKNRKGYIGDIKNKNPKIFNENGEDISKEFNIDKNKGSEFFFEQTQISEDMFLATSIAMQQEVKIEKEMKKRYTMEE